MPTTVVHSIGTASRDYSTLQAWEDACPADLTAVDQIWQGEAYNDSEFTTGVTFGGITTDATRYCHITVAAGQSWIDDAGVRSNPLRYDQSKGAGLHVSGSYANGFSATGTGIVVRLSRWQIKFDSFSGTFPFSVTIAKDVLSQGGSVVLAVEFYNVVRLNGGFSCSNSSGGKIHGCLAMIPSDLAPSAGQGIDVSGYTGCTVTSTVVLGFTTVSDDITKLSSSSDYNATDLATGFPVAGTHNVYGVPYSSTSPLVNAASSSLDARAAAGSALLNAGLLDGTNAPNDISGTARDATPTIGPWELVTVAGGGNFGRASINKLRPRIFAPGLAR